MDLPDVRDGVAAHTPRGLSAKRAQSVLLAVGEACINAIEHAYRDTTRERVRVRVETAGDAEVHYIDSAGTSVPFTHAERAELIATALLAPILERSGLTSLTTVRKVEE